MLRKELESKQSEIDLNPFDCKIREEHTNILFDFNVACNDEEKLLFQRSKINWLQEGDNNTKFFHRVVKSRGNRNRILMVIDEDGRWVSGKAMKDKFVTHFNKFLGCKDVTEFSCLNDGFFHNKLDSRVAANMIRVVTNEEIKVAMFDIDENRAPGPDGYSSKFFKRSWIIVGLEVCKAVREFFLDCKIIVNRIRNSLGDIVSKNQSAFIPGRSIVDNILLAQELMVGYKNKRGVPKCTIKIDIQKAYDTVDWNFLSRILQGFGFHTIMIQWIMACVSTPWFMLNFNGEDHGVEGEHGKNQIFFSCVKPNMRRIILGILPFDIGRFPFKYLGIPMCVTNYLIEIVNSLLKKIKMRIFNWKSKALSFAGRLQLINSVLTSIHVYSASIFKIPIATIKEIEKLCKSFLWANGEVVKGKAKVKWNDICKPKIYGGLGVKNLRKWNDALLAKHVWNVINSKNSLWVQWVKSNYIGNRNFWDILQKKSMSWTWKRFLEVRKIVRPHVVSCVGNGMNTSLWHDWWHPIVYDCYTWPVEWVNIFPGLKDAPMFCIEPNLRDVAGWRDKKGICKQFSCKQVWCDINNFGDQVPWHDIVWYGNCIRRNSFILWMAILNRLKTQDRVRGWEVSGNLLCPFCAVTPDSHVHLFFKCDYSQLIWSLLVGGYWFWGWHRRMFNFGDLNAVDWWGHFWNKFLYKGIDELCYWFESLLSNHVTCTYGIFYLDMIFIEIIQMENPRHVIDAMSSMKLVLISWSFAVSLLWFGLCLICRNFLQRLGLDHVCKQM
ncbi:unnamed protein product [Lactuca virosa]|uniref:Reverse transcriptase domain-containing protein n=1 Tax=Lactuca virosa TaxID=75947 RepID=A0AAU9NRT1_9ASTR|nr:unnamed protein product [Lactuca virosa]